jgi:hypothetical protein
MDPFQAWFPAVAFVFLIPIVAIVGGITYSIFALRQKTRLQELAYRERIARIERGLTAAPEVDPAGFEEVLDSQPAVTTDQGRFVSGGITLMGVGVGMYWMLTALGARDVGVGVGGFMAILGAAMFVNALVQVRLFGRTPPQRRAAPPAAPQPRSDANPQPPGL